MYAWEMTLTGIDRALMALDVLDEPQATPLDPKAERRLHALLAERGGAAAAALPADVGGRCGRLRLAVGYGAACLQRGCPASVFLRRAPCACTGALAGSHACCSGLESTGGAGPVRFGVPAGAQLPCAPALQLPCTDARLCLGGPRAGPSTGAVPGAAHQLANCAPARRAAGQQLVPEEIACVCSTALGSLLARTRVSERMPVVKIIGGMRCLYAMLQWTLRRITELARHGRTARKQAAAPMHVAHALALAANSALSLRRSFMHGPVPACSAAAMCLQASHHHRPAHLVASRHACARGSLALTTGLAGKSSGSQCSRWVPAASCIRWRGCPAQSADEASAPSRASLNITFEHALQHTCGRLARCHWPWLRLVRPRTSVCPGQARTLCVRHGAWLHVAHQDRAACQGLCTLRSALCAVLHS